MNVARSLIALLWLVASCGLQAAPGSRLLATGGVTQVEGSAGGGTVPWAVIAGYGADTEVGGSLFHSRVGLDDFTFNSSGLALGLYNRVELSAAQQRLDVHPLGLTIEQDVIGAKARIGGQLIYGPLPQISLGVQHKRNRDMTIPTALGATDDSGTDIYASASKLWLAAAGGYNLLTNLTLRRTEANQMGLLGFGSRNSRADRWHWESSAALFLNARWALGFDYRQKPDNLGLGEEDWWDGFIAWFPSKRLAVVAAHADLGSIAGLKDQRGWYLSVQLSQ